MSNDLKFRALLDDKVSGGLAKIRDQLDTIGGKGTAATAFGFVAAKGLDLMAGAALGAGRAVGDFIGDSIKAASDLDETLSKSKVVFGDQAGAVADWGKTAAAAFGLSRQEAIEAAASFGNVFKGLGFASKQSADMSEKLVQLAGDLASFNNIDPTQALEKLRSGLAGESEPLRSVGVFLTEAAVKAKAMQLGLVDAHGELSEGAKIQARYALILEQTTTAQGDFSRTADGLANSQRKVNAEIKDAQARLGKEMLPAQLEVTKAQLHFFEGLNLVADSLGGKVTPAFIGLAAAQGRLGDITNAVRGKLKELDDETLGSATVAGIFTQAEYDAEMATRHFAGQVSQTSDHVGKSADDIADSARLIATSAKTAAADASASFSKITSAALGARDKLLTSATDTVHGYFDVIQAEDNLTAANAQIAAAKRVLASKTATDAEKRDAHSALTSAQRDRSEALAVLAENGATQSKVFTKTMAGLYKELTTAHGRERDAINAEILRLEVLAAKAYSAWQRLQPFMGGGALPTYGGGRASGGPVSPGGIYTVGEEGRETLVMGSSGGYVLPNAGGSASGGSAMVSFTYAPQYSTASAAEAQRFSAAILPELVRELRRQTII